MIAARAATGMDVALVILAVGLLAIGALTVLVLFIAGGLDDPDEQLPEFEDIEPPTTPRSLR